MSYEYEEGEDLGGNIRYENERYEQAGENG
jgi:hypothetical protein